jgi:hypothetical protein
MCAIHIRAATKNDLPRLTEIYNHYVVNTPIIFDIEPYTVERRATWFQQFGVSGRHRLLVAEDESGISGYAGTTKFRPKAAYETTVLVPTAHRTRSTKGWAAHSTLRSLKRWPARIFAESSWDTQCRTPLRLRFMPGSDSNLSEYSPRTAGNSGATGT